MIFQQSVATLWRTICAYDRFLLHVCAWLRTVPRKSQKSSDFQYHRLLIHKISALIHPASFFYWGSKFLTKIALVCSGYSVCWKMRYVATYRILPGKKKASFWWMMPHDLILKISKTTSTRMCFPMKHSKSASGVVDHIRCAPWPWYFLLCQQKKFPSFQ